MQSRKRIIIADDYPAFRECLVWLLQEIDGLDIVGEAENGFQAVEMTMRLHPDIVIMDIHMPVMDGIQATRRITNELCDVRVIGLSMGDEAEAKEMIEAGAVDCIRKDGLIKNLQITIKSRSS